MHIIFVVGTMSWVKTRCYWTKKWFLKCRKNCPPFCNFYIAYYIFFFKQISFCYFSKNAYCYFLDLKSHWKTSFRSLKVLPFSSAQKSQKAFVKCIQKCLFQSFIRLVLNFSFGSRIEALLCKLTYRKAYFLIKYEKREIKRKFK